MYYLCFIVPRRRYILIQLIALVGVGERFCRDVTIIHLYIMKSNIYKEAHSVGLELGGSSYEVQLYINP